MYNRVRHAREEPQLRQLCSPAGATVLRRPTTGRRRRLVSARGGEAAPPSCLPPLSARASFLRGALPPLPPPPPPPPPPTSTPSHPHPHAPPGRRRDISWWVSVRPRARPRRPPHGAVAPRAARPRRRPGRARRKRVVLVEMGIPESAVAAETSDAVGMEAAAAESSPRSRPSCSSTTVGAVTVIQPNEDGSYWRRSCATNDPHEGERLR